MSSVTTSEKFVIRRGLPGFGDESIEHYLTRENEWDIDANNAMTFDTREAGEAYLAANTVPSLLDAEESRVGLQWE